MTDHLSAIKALLDDATLKPDIASSLLETVADLAEKYTTLEQLHDQETQQHNDILRTLTFELRTFLNPVLSYTQLMLDERVGELNPDQKKLMESVVSHSQHVLTQLRAFTDLGNIKAGKIMLHPEAVDICDLLDVMKERFAKNNVKLIAHCAPDVGTLNIDRMHLLLTIEYLLLLERNFQSTQTVELIASRDPTIVRLAFATRPTGFKADRILDIYHGLVQQQWEPNEFLAIRMSVAYHLCSLMGGSLIIEKTSNGMVGYLMEFDTAHAAAR